MIGNIALGDYDPAMSKDLPPSRTAPQFVVRLPSEEFRDQIAEAAKGNGRSMNAEIVARLQGSFEGGDASAAAADFAQRLFQAEYRYALMGKAMLELMDAGGLPAVANQAKWSRWRTSASNAAAQLQPLGLRLIAELMELEGGAETPAQVKEEIGAVLGPLRKAALERRLTGKPESDSGSEGKAPAPKAGDVPAKKAKVSTVRYKRN